MNGFDTTLTIRKMKDDKKSDDHVAKPVDMNILAPTMMKYL